MNIYTISVAIITRNREKLLKNCLLSLSRQTILPSEVLVIDNDSTDRTKKIVTSFKKELPIRYFFEPKVGIPFARNRAFKKARGEILAFIDDDCTASITWVEKIIEAHQKYPKATAIQGKTVPMPKESMLATVTHELHTFWLTINKKGNRLFVCDTKNASFKLRHIKRHKIRFNVLYKRGSDVDFAKQIISKGGQIIYVSKIRDYHWERTNILSFLKQKYYQGRSRAHSEYTWTSVNKNSSNNTSLEDVKHVVMKKYSLPNRIAFRLIFWLRKSFYERGYQDEQKRLQVALEPIGNRPVENNISVAIVTKDRAKQLSQCFFALTQQVLFPKEILIIDNGSTDDTRIVASSFKKILPIRYIYEPQIGIPFARNTALREAQGKIVAFTDDDCEPTPFWLSQMITAHKKYPKVAVIQGESIGKHLHNPLGIISHMFHEVTIKKNLIGRKNLLYLDTKNVSFKLPILKKYKLRFTTELLRGSDVDFAKQLLAKKQKIFFYPSAKIFFSPRENVQSFLLQRFRWAKANIKIYNSWPKEYFPIFLQKRPNKTLLEHSLVKKHWYYLPFIASILILTKYVELLGKFIGKRGMAYLNLGYGGVKNILYRKNSIFKTISIGIITKNRPGQLGRLLRSLSIQSRLPNEVIIVDSSKDKQAVKIAYRFRKFFNLRIIKQKALGRGIARNAILSKASSDIIAFIDDDMEASPGWTEQMLAGHNIYKETIAIQGRILSRGKTPWALVEQFRMDKWFIEKTNKQNMMEILTTKNVSFKRAVIEALDLRFAEHVDPAFADLIGEDVEFAKRLLGYKRKIKYLPSALSFHWERPTLSTFVKQQYRKGFSYGLVKKAWPHFYYNPTKRSSWFIKSRFFLPLIEMLFHPVVGKHKKKLLFLLVIYYASVAAYFKGYLDSRNDKKWLYSFKPAPVNNNRNFPLITIAIITRNRANELRRVLYSLLHQEASASEILIIDNGSSDNTKDVIEFFKKRLPIRYFVEKRVGVAYARNRALGETKTKILAFIDDDCEADYTWLTNHSLAHIKYPDAVAIQGMTESVPAENAYSILTRFNRQTWIRDNMLGDRNLFWDLVKGRVDSGIPLLICDTRNVSLKLDVIKRYNVRFDENLKNKGDDYDFAKQLLHHKQTIIFYPQARVYHYERIDLKAFLMQRWYHGQSSKYIFTKWRKKYFPSVKRGFLKRFGAFLYFSLANSYIVKLPALTILFCLSEGAYFLGKRQKDPFSKLLSKQAG